VDEVARLFTWKRLLILIISEFIALTEAGAFACLLFVFAVFQIKPHWVGVDSPCLITKIYP